MTTITRLLPSLLLALAFGACGTDSSPSSSGTDKTDKTDGTAATDSTDGTGSGTDSTDSSGCEYAAEFSGEACNPLCPDQSGCAAGENCTLTAAGAIACASDATQALGLSCNDDNVCAEGGCVTVPGQSNKKCRPFCKVPGDCFDGDKCNIEVDISKTKASFCGAPPSDCSIFLQDCDAGQACYLGGGTYCAAPGAGEIGDDCATETFCKPGLICVESRCHQGCNSGTSGPDPKCNLICPNDTAELQNVTGIGICSLPDESQKCDLSAPNCPAGESCYYLIDGPRCKPTGSTAAGEACGESQDCVPGLVCWPSQSTCKPICKPEEDKHEECKNVLSPCSGLAGTSVGFCDE